MSIEQQEDAFDFGPLADAHISRYTAAFVYADTGKPKLCGSGTLVKTARTQGILTCGHVLDSISSQNEIGICVFPVRANALQKAKIPVRSFSSDAVRMYDKASLGEGPDLAFVPLSADIMGSLAASASVVDLDIHAARAATPRPDYAGVFEAISGAISEMTAEPELNGTKMVLKIEGLTNVGQIIPVGDNTAGFDLLSFRPKSDNGFKLPDSYRGTSGGGVWRTYVRQQDDGLYDVVERRFLGVAFQQFGEKIQCHGPDSLYSRFLPEMRRHWP